jgi:anion-transporting  ArsA/GET3 family ATPase
LAADTPRSLLDRRVVIVTGKGGTGKTTVTAALAIAAAKAGKRVLIAEMGRDEHIPRLLSPGSPAVGYAGRDLMPGIRAMRIDPFEALGEYLVLQIGLKPLVGSVMKNQAFQQLMSAAPGWRELITLGKIWRLEQLQDPDGRPSYDLIVVDAPATGHGVTFLDVPRVVISAVRAGPLHQHSEAVEALIEDRERTLLLPVTLAEELPVRETNELIERVRTDLSIAVDRVVVNAVAPAPFPAGLEHLDDVLARLSDTLPLGALPPPSQLAACARTLRLRHELNAGFITEIAAGTGLPLVVLPQLRGGIEGPREIEELASALVATPTPEGL